jgi:hypothetical protein
MDKKTIAALNRIMEAIYKGEIVATADYRLVMKWMTMQPKWHSLMMN